MLWIEILDQVQENSRNTSLLRSTIEYYSRKDTYQEYRLMEI